MSASNAKEIATRLRRLANEVGDTAVGSSRIKMYENIANRIREEATKVDALANVGTAEFRATKESNGA